MNVKSVRLVGKADVYNMTVEDTHNFIIQGGVVSHNCDEIRYMCMMRPIAPRKIETTYVPISDPLNQYQEEGGRFSNYYNLTRRT